MSIESKQPRRYQHIWEALKKTEAGSLDMVTLELPREDHKTVLNALRKESLKDRAFRFECTERNKSFEIGYNQIGDTLQLFLRWKSYVTKAFIITPERIAKMRKWK